MNDSVKKVAIPTLGAMTIAAWVIGVEPIVFKTVFGLFIAATGLPILGLVYNGMKAMFARQP